MALSDLFSAKASIAEKMNVLTSAKLVATSIPGVSDISTNAKKSATMSVVSKFKKQDLDTVQGKSTAGQTPEQARADQTQYNGALTYPSHLKYYARFSFKAYKRASVGIDAIELPQVEIVLPIPANLQESFSIGYDSPALGPFLGPGSEFTANALREMQAPGSILNTVGNLAGMATLDGIISAIGQSGYVGVRGAASGIVHSNVLASIDKVTGLVPNPHLSLIFNNVNLRQHNFHYMFAPNSKRELQTLKEIIRTMKKRMLPGLTINTKMLMTFPDTVDITFGPEDNQPYKIKQCVLAQFNVNYAPMGTPAFFKTGDPVAVSIDMTFQETEQFTRSDLDRKNEGLGTNSERDL